MAVQPQRDHLPGQGGTDLKCGATDINQAVTMHDPVDLHGLTGGDSQRALGVRQRRTSRWWPSRTSTAQGQPAQVPGGGPRGRRADQMAVQGGMDAALISPIVSTRPATAAAMLTF